VSGYYGRHNTGDNALAACVAWGLARRVRHVHVHSPTPLVLPGCDGLRTVASGGRRGRLARLWSIARADLHVWGGGSVFSDRDGIASLVQKERLSRWSRWFGTETAAFGVSLGPIGSDTGRELLLRMLDGMTGVVVRDEDSVRLATELGMASRVHLAPDPAILLDHIGLPEPGPEEAASPCLTLAPTRLPSGPGSGDPAILTRALRRFLRDRGWRARILVMDGSREHGDEGLARDLAEALDPAAADVVPYDPNPLQVYREIQRSRGLVGMRLHSVVFAFAAGVPYLAVAYHPKVAAFDATQAEGRCTLSRGDWTESGIVARLERCMDAAADAPLAATEGARAEIEGAFDWLMTTCGQAP